MVASLVDEHPTEGVVDAQRFRRVSIDEHLNIPRHPRFFEDGDATPPQGRFRTGRLANSIAA